MVYWKTRHELKYEVKNILRVIIKRNLFYN